MGTVLHHEGGRIVHGRLGLNIKALEHLVTIPATDQFYDSGIDADTEKHHGAGCAEGPGGHIIGIEASVAAVEGDRGFQCP